MSIEETLKQMIIDRYGSVLEFTNVTKIPYSTLTSILRRGIQTATVSNVIMVCNALHISADGLAAGKIVPVSSYGSAPAAKTSIEDIFEETKRQLSNAEILSLDGMTIDSETVAAFNDGIDMILELAKRHQNRTHTLTESITESITEPNKIDLNNKIDL